MSTTAAQANQIAKAIRVAGGSTETSSPATQVMADRINAAASNLPADPFAGLN